MDHAELVSKLAVGARWIQHSQGVLPETASHGQNRVVLSEMSDIVLVMTNCGAG